MAKQENYAGVPEHQKPRHARDKGAPQEENYDGVPLSQISAVRRKALIDKGLIKPEAVEAPAPSPPEKKKPGRKK